MAKKKQIEWSAEERHNSQLRDLEKQLYLIPEPTYMFKIGDSVLIGALEDVVVSQVLHNGKIYEITYSHTKSNWGNPIKTTGMKMYVQWMSIRKLSTTTDSFV